MVSTKQASPLASSDTTSCRLTVTGMDCGGCAQTIDASLATIPGVQSSSTSFTRGSVDIRFDQNLVEQAVLRDRITSLGYGVVDPPALAPVQTPWVFDVAGMDCGDCAKTIEAGVRRLPGVERADVNFSAGRLTVVSSDTATSQDAVVAAVTAAGYGATIRTGPAGAQVAPVASPVWWRQRRILEVAAASALWILGFILERTSAGLVVAVVPFLAAMVLAGYPVARSGWFAVKARRADMNVLMTVAAVGAIAIGQWDEGASVLILFAIGLTLQNLTLDRTRRALQALVTLTPAEARVQRDGREALVPVASVEVGERVFVRPGDRVPVDGTVLTGFSSVDQASITGESIPVDVAPEATVFAGSINGEGALEVRSTKPASDTTLARIIHLVEEAQASKAPAQAFVDRFAAIYTPIVIAAAAVLALIVPIFVGDFREWVFRALVLLVVACPCALVISTPVALVAAIGSASRRGVLFKGGLAIELLASVRAVAFDKTGTLTAGRPQVVDVVPVGTGVSADQLLAQAAAVEQQASHPIARSIVAEAQRRDVRMLPALDTRTIPGRGAQARVGNELVLIGSRRLFAVVPAEVEDQLRTFEQAGKTSVLIGTADAITGIISVADPLRPESAGAVTQLTELNVRTLMLTGDNQLVAERIGGAVGVSDVRANLLPEDKVTAIDEALRRSPVAMVGDGVNDAPALAHATVGIAMGGAGTDVAIEAADIALISDELERVPWSIRMARRTMTIIHQNIAASIAVKVVFLVLTFVGVTNLWLAVLADTGMALLVTFNSLRLLRPNVAVASPTTPSLATPGNEADTDLSRMAAD